MPQPVATRAWWELEGDALAREVWDLAEGLRSEQSGRRRRALDALQRYEGRRLSGLYASAYTAAELEERAYHLGRTMVDSLTAEMAGSGRPKPQFITSGADWKVRRRARKLDRLVEATLCQPQGRHVDAWDLAEDALLVDCMIWGVGVLKVLADEDRACIERTFPFELFVDPFEARYGSPLNLFHVYYVDKSKLLERFGDDEETRAKIETATSVIDSDDALTVDSYAIARRCAASIRVVEAWRLPVSKDKPGKHAFAIDGALLHAEDYTEPDFPFVVMRWSPERIGYWARSLIEEVAPLEDIVNDSGAMMNEKVRICSGRRVYFHENTVSEEHLEANDAESFVPVQQGASFPHEVTPEPLASSELAWWQTNFAKAFEMPGVSQMLATSQIEPGVTAGIALRTRANLAAKRFANKTRRYENCFVDLGRKIVRVVRAIADENPGFAARWPGRHFLEEISWKDVNLDEDQYEVTIQAASMLQREPAGILSTAQELFASGTMSAPSFKRIVAQIEDLENELSRDTAEYGFLDKIIDRYLDADEETWGPFDYEAPDGHITDKVAAMMQLTSAYFEARQDDAPEFNLELLRRYMKELDAQILSAQQAMAAAAAPPVPTNAPAPAGAPPSPAEAVAAAPSLTVAA